MLIDDSNSKENKAESLREEIAELRKDAGVAARIQEETAIFDQAVAGIATGLFVEDETEAGVIANFVGAMSGAFIATGFFSLRKKLPKRFRDKLNVTQANPWSRRFKTLFVLGQKCGELAGDFLPIPLHLPFSSITRKMFSKVTGYFTGILFGIAGIAFFKGDLSEAEEKIFRFGRDAWTKYAKTGLTFGYYLGIVIGAVVGTFLLPGVGTLAGTLIGGAIGSITGFITAMVAVPIINKIKNAYAAYKAKKNPAFPEKKPEEAGFFNSYRTNYIRAGMALGGGIGGIIGGLLGVFLLPGLGAIPGTLIGAAFGSLLGGVVYGIAGPYISKRFGLSDNVNSHDYAIRTASMFGGTNGLGQGLSPLSPKLGAITPSIGSTIFGLIGVARQTYKAKKAGATNPEEDDYILPWTQRAATGVMMGSAIGAFIGFFIFPPFGSPIGAGLGGLLGGIIACAAEPLLRKLGFLPKLPTTNTQPTNNTGERAPPPADQPNQNKGLSRSDSKTPIPSSPIDIRNKLQKLAPSASSKSTVSSKQEQPIGAPPKLVSNARFYQAGPTMWTKTKPKKPATSQIKLCQYRQTTEVSTRNSKHH